MALQSSIFPSHRQFFRVPITIKKCINIILGS
jgi:hypothetical protein